MNTPRPPGLAAPIAAAVRGHGRLGVVGLALACCLLVPASALSRAPAADEGDELIAVLKTNGVRRGEFTLLRRPDGDFWIEAEDLPALRLEPRTQARRQLGTRTYYSARSLGAQRVDFDEAQLTLSIDFDPEALEQSLLDIAARRRRSARPEAAATPQRTSLILSYRLSLLRNFQTGAARAAMSNELAVRTGPVLLRQETALDTGALRRFVRGPSQAIWDDVKNARRWTFGDVLSTAGPYGTTILGGGLLLAKFYDLAPEVIRYPVATIRASTPLPSQVEVSVDGNPIYRTQVGPGPITLTNIAVPGGLQNVRVTVTDASGHQQVIEQPFLFTDAALGRGFHEYSYFAGKRSEQGANGVRQYLEPAWQGHHRYGVTNNVTVSGGGEGNKDFTNAGAGITLRSDRLGLLSADLLGSVDRVAGTRDTGWGVRYTYLLPSAALQLARRRFGKDFRTFVSNDTFGLLRDETRIAAATQWGGFGLSLDLVRSVFATERRDTAIVRASTRLARGISITSEYQRQRINGNTAWMASVFLRADLDDRHWVNTFVRATEASRGFDIETGKPLPAGEGLGYRVGMSHTSGERGSSYGYGAAEWALRYATLDGFLSVPADRGGPHYGQVGISGAFAALDGYWGVTRRINDSFAVADLGVPQAGVQILLNNQVQGSTDAQGKLFIPQVGSHGRQEIGVDERQLDMTYALQQKARTIAPTYRSGTVVHFGARRIRALAGTAWIVRGGVRQAVDLRSWIMQGADARFTVRTGRDGDFYLEDVKPGRYRGDLTDDKGTHACEVTIPDFREPVHELAEGILCE